MARPRKNAVSSTNSSLPPMLFLLAEAIGEAMGRSLAQALHSNNGMILGAGSAAVPMRKRGRPPKNLSGTPVAADRRCTVPGCGRESRSKGLCSAHYQAARRRSLNPEPKS